MFDGLIAFSGASIVAEEWKKKKKKMAACGKYNCGHDPSINHRRGYITFVSTLLWGGKNNPGASGGLSDPVAHFLSDVQIQIHFILKNKTEKTVQKHENCEQISKRERTGKLENWMCLPALRHLTNEHNTPHTLIMNLAADPPQFNHA